MPTVAFIQDIGPEGFVRYGGNQAPKLNPDNVLTRFPRFMDFKRASLDF